LLALDRRTLSDTGRAGIICLRFSGGSSSIGTELPAVVVGLHCEPGRIDVYFRIAEICRGEIGAVQFCGAEISALQIAVMEIDAARIRFSKAGAGV